MQNEKWASILIYLDKVLQVVSDSMTKLEFAQTSFRYKLRGLIIRLVLGVSLLVSLLISLFGLLFICLTHLNLSDMVAALIVVAANLVIIGVVGIWFIATRRQVESPKLSTTAILLSQLSHIIKIIAYKE